MKKILFLILLCPFLFAQRTTSVGISMIKHYEGFRGKTYLCPASVMTIGYGHLISKPMVITEYQAEQLLIKDLPRYEKYVSNSSGRILKWNEFDALVSFTFNVGCRFDNNFRDNISLGRTSLVIVQMSKYIHGGGIVLKGLINRRKSETNLYKNAILTFY